MIKTLKKPRAVEFLIREDGRSYFWKAVSFHGEFTGR